MTNEEAAAMLESMKNYFLPTSPMLEERREITALDLAISALSKQCASTEQVGKDIKFPTIHCCRGYDCIKDENGITGFGVYDPKEKNIYIAGDVPKEIFLKALFHEIFHWMQNVAGMKFDEDDANSFSDILYDAVDMFDDHGPELFGQKTIVEPGEVFVGENVLKEALDQSADSDKIIKLEKRTITERLIIAESLINSVIVDSDQFRDTTKKTEDAPDMNVGKIPYKKPEIIKYERHYDHTDCIWYRYLGEEEPNECPSTCSQYRDGWNDAMDYIFCNGKGYQPYERKAK